MDRLNILSLWPLNLATRKQSPSRRYVLRALAERDDVTLHQSGPGFPDWDNDASGVANVERIMPDCHFILSYKAISGCEYGRVNNPLAVTSRWLVGEQFNEAHSGFGISVNSPMHPGGGTVVEECQKAGTRLVVIHHANDRDRVKAVENYGARLVHIPHGAAPMFLQASRPWSERTGIVLTGSLGTHYPLRCRWKNLIDRGRIDGRYFVRPNNYSKSVAESDKLVQDYANALGSCRVKLGCTSLWRYGLQHLSEAALAGCAHVCDLPDDLLYDMVEYDQMMHAVDPNASDDVLVAAVEYALEHAQSIGERAQRTALASFTTAHYAERLVNVIREMLKDERN